MMDHTKLKRNKYNNAIINTDSTSFKKYVVERQQNRKVYDAVRQVDTLRKDVDDIKDMLRTLINGMNKNG
jgi:hypothetical protein